ncbi:MAG: glycosyltransferase family 4 protein [Planctomycetota bacterium]|jgi:glycosyltransferase involved in cell wall biosynthesis
MSRKLRILHLLSDWKWTGPAEPAVDLAAAMAGRGHDVWFACEQPPHEVEDWVGKRVEARGLRLISDLKLRKHFKLGANLGDLWRIPALLQEHDIDVVHCHRGQDHLVAGIAVRRRKLPIAVVRTSYEGIPLKPTLRNRYLLRRCTTRLITIAESATRADAQRFGLRPDQVVTIDAPIDLQRFTPGAPGRPPAAIRAELGLPEDAIVAGIVARQQRRRRFDKLFEAFQRAHQQEPRLRLVMVGRGTHSETVVRRPLESMGLTEFVKLAGYRGGGDFVDVVRAFDLCLFLVPGTDGSCRALRQAMALGKPGLVARRGMLPEIITHGHDGLVVESDGAAEVESLAAGLVRLGQDAEFRAGAGAAARATAVARFDPAKQAEAVEACYRDALAEVRSWS